MTIIIGFRDEMGTTIGTDSLYTWEDGFVKPQGHKFISLPSEYIDKVLVAASGQEKFSQVFERVVRDTPKLLSFSDRYGVMKLASKLFAEVGKLGVGDAENNNLPEHDLGFVLASVNSKNLWTIDTDYSVGEHEHYVCMGSGYAIAESAILALTLPEVSSLSTNDLVLGALVVTCTLHPYCGGLANIRRVEDA